MRPDEIIAGLESCIDDKNIVIVEHFAEIKELRSEVLRLRNGLRMLLVADSWEEQPGPVLVEYVNQLLAGFERPFIREDEKDE